MFKLAETILFKEFNVQYMYIGVSAQNDLSFLANYMKWKRSDIVYVTKLGAK